MKTERFIRKSFPVEGVQVTEENFEQVAKWTKGTICYTDPKIAEKFKRPVQKWIEIEVKNPMNDRQTKAFVGDYVLFANSGFKIYTPGAFEKNFDRAPAPTPKAPKKVATSTHANGKVHEHAPRIVADNGHEDLSHDISVEVTEALEQGADPEPAVTA